VWVSTGSALTEVKTMCIDWKAAGPGLGGVVDSSYLAHHLIFSDEVANKALNSYMRCLEKSISLYWSVSWAHKPVSIVGKGRVPC
jgi:hypothetical protein